jgi:LysM repeat protein
MSEKVTIKSSDQKTWTPFQEGQEFLKFLEKKKEEKKDVFDTKTIRDITENTAGILSKCINPSKLNSNNSASTGLVIGQIQSGKTLSMTALSAMSKDNGFGIVIVMSGSVTPLSSQTAGRLGKELQGRTINKIFNNPKRDWIKGQNINIVKKFSENYKKKENQTTGKKTLLVVTHKNPARINMISEIFENTPISNNIPTLIIDDEADHHSLNSKDFLNDISRLSEKRRHQLEEVYQVKSGETLEHIAEREGTTAEELKEINDGLKDGEEPREGQWILLRNIETATHSAVNRLRKNFKFHTFLGYTATPFALTLIDTINSLAPDFFYTLQPGKNYTGLNFYFPPGEDGTYKNSSHIKDIEPDIADTIGNNQIPDSLNLAIKIYVLGVAVGISKNDHEDDTKNRTMMIHPHNEVEYHKNFYGYTDDILKNIEFSIRNKNDVAYSESIKELKTIYNNHVIRLISNPPKFDDKFIDCIRKSVSEEIKIEEFNARDKKRIPSIDWKEDYGKILVGGVGLDRGYTVEGLTISYLSRSLGGRQDDTMLQRARFFGYHKKYQEFINIFIPKNLQNFYQEICEINDNFLKSLEKFQKTGKSFKEWEREWFGSNAARHELTRRGIIRFNLRRYRGDRTVVNKYSHKLSDKDLANNVKVYKDLRNRCQSEMVPLENIKDINSEYLSWAKHIKNIYVCSSMTAQELYNDYLSKIVFHKVEKTAFGAINTNLGSIITYDSYKNLKCPVFFMNHQDLADNETERTVLESGGINPFRGYNKTDPQGFPGHRKIHYDYMTGVTDDSVGEDCPSLQVYYFGKIWKKGQKQKAIEKEGVPYFNIYPARNIWKDYVRGFRRFRN